VLRKTRHYPGRIAEAEGSVDRFEGALYRLIMVEAEFDDMEALRAYAMPDLAFGEMTNDNRHKGGELVAHSFPQWL